MQKYWKRKENLVISLNVVLSLLCSCRKLIDSPKPFRASWMKDPSPRFARLRIQIFTELSFRKIWSTHTEGETPVPIPNTEVKTLRANGSVVVRLCESRSVLL